MTKTDNSHSIRLYESIQKHVNEETASRIANKIQLSKSADINKKFLWAETTCRELEQEFDNATVKAIRMDCACGPEFGKINKLKKLYQSADDINDFVKKANNLNQGFTIKHEENSLFIIYPQCYCSCVKRIDQPISKSWCYCTLGYTKKMFSNVLDQEVDVELIDSVKLGGKECIIEIKLK